MCMNRIGELNTFLLLLVSLGHSAITTLLSNKRALPKAEIPFKYFKVPRWLERVPMAISEVQSELRASLKNSYPILEMRHNPNCHLR